MAVKSLGMDTALLKPPHQLRRRALLHRLRRKLAPVSTVVDQTSMKSQQKASFPIQPQRFHHPKAAPQRAARGDGDPMSGREGLS